MRRNTAQQYNGLVIDTGNNVNKSQNNYTEREKPDNKRMRQVVAFV